MAGGADIKAGQAYVRLYMRDDLTTRFRGALTAIGTGIAKAAAGLAAMGTAAAVGAVAAAKHFADVGSELADMSARTGVAASSLAELKFAAEQSGASLDDFEKALRFMAKEGMSVDDFDKMAKEISSIADPSERAAKAMETWGKSGTKLLPMLEGLAELRLEARNLGLTPSDEDIARADAMGDSFDKLKATVSAAWFKVGASAAIVLQPMVERLSQIVVATTKWVSENEMVVNSLKKIGDAITATPLVAFQQKILALRIAWKEMVAEFWGTLFLEGTGMESEFGKAFIATMRGELAVMRTDLDRLTIEMLGQRGGGQGHGQGKEKSASDMLAGNSVQSSFSAGGAVALQWAGASGIAAKTLEEIRAMKKLMAESVRLAKEMAARRDRPGIFRN